MEPPSPQRFNFRDGVIMRPGELLITAGLDNMDADKRSHTVYMTWSAGEGWKGGKRDWTSISVCAGKVPVEDVVILGDDREFLAFGDRVIDGVACKRGTVSSVRAIGGRPYIAGMANLVLRREAVERWEPVDLKLADKLSFEAIAGTDNDNFCLVGWDGAIVVVERGIATPVHSPTNVILTGICLGGDGNYYACGQNGVLLRGKGQLWEPIAVDETDESFWDVCWFQGRLLVATLLGVHQLTEDGTLEKLDIGDAVMGSAYCLHALDDKYLLSVGASDILYYDGSDWEMIV